jgi:hypothetical protein
VRQLSQQICKFQLNEARFLNYRPSEIAAASVIIAANIHEKQQKDKVRGDNHEHEGQRTLEPFRTDIWDNPLVVSQTGYRFDQLREATHDLCAFMRKSIVPDKLEGFDLRCLKS